jgi:hypothetical protein
VERAVFLAIQIVQAVGIGNQTSLQHLMDFQAHYSELIIRTLAIKVCTSLAAIFNVRA